MKRIRKITYLIILCVLLIIVPSTQTQTHAYWNTTQQIEEVEIIVGSWEWLIPQFNSNQTYRRGDKFIYNGQVWEVTSNSFNSTMFALFGSVYAILSGTARRV